MTIDYRRKPIPKKLRQQVYNKYNGHCAYCGKKIDYSEMQVDHVIPIAKSMYGPVSDAEKVQKMFEDGSIHELNNLMPACRQCNFYKGGYDIEAFRKRILEELDHTCRSSFQVKLAEKYGILTYKPWGGKFYFEIKKT